MTNTWILVANASCARLFINNGPNKGLKIVREFQHQASREKASDLVSDRPGHFNSGGNGRGAYVATIDPKRNEAEHFAHELAKTLEQGRTSNIYQRLILVAPPAFMGAINSHIGSHVRTLISDSIEKDYTKTSEKEICGHLEHCIYL